MFNLMFNDENNHNNLCTKTFKQKEGNNQGTIQGVNIESHTFIPHAVVKSSISLFWDKCFSLLKKYIKTMFPFPEEVS